MKATGSPVLKDGVERARVTVDHAFAASGQRMAGRDLVQAAQYRAAACVRAVRALAGVIGRPAGDVTQDVPAAVIDAKKARRIGVTGGFQIRQDPGGEPAASIPGATDGITDPDDFQGVAAAAQRLLNHPTMVAHAPERPNPPGAENSGQ